MRTRAVSIRVFAVVFLVLLVSSVSLPVFAAGPLYAWGDTEYNQCAVPPGSDFVAVSAGLYHSVALRSDGSLAAWGSNDSGECNVPSGNDYIAVSAGGWHSVAIKSDHSLVAWGNNESGQCNVPAGTDFVAVASGHFFSVALRSDHSLAGWGTDDFGLRNAPSGSNYTAVATGLFHGLALKSDGSISVWGNDDYLQLNVPDGNDFTAIAAGGWHSLALRTDGSLAGWGLNNNNESDVPAGFDYTGVRAGQYFNIVTKSDGSLFAWGANNVGQLNMPPGRNYQAISTGSFHAVVIDDAPVNVSLTPSGGSLASGTPYTLSGVYSDANGFENVRRAYLLLNDSLGQANAALLMYDRAANRIYLKNDANTSWGTGYPLGANVTLENSQCYVYVKDTTKSESGNNLTVNWRIGLKSAFAVKVLNGYLYAQDWCDQKDGWDLMARYYNVKPECVSINPVGSSLPINSTTTLTSVYRDLNGLADMRKCYLWINDNNSQANAVLIWYDRATNKLYLKNDANTSWGTGYALGTDVTLSNSQCEVYVKDTTATGSGDDLTIVWSLKLKTSMTSKNLYSWMYVTDSKAAFDGWRKMGTHFTPTAPSCLSITPSSGNVQTGTPLVFTAHYSDDNGNADIWQCWFQMGQTGSLANNVVVLYDAKQGKVFLRNDANTSWGTGYAPGTDVVLENSRCKVYVEDTVVTPVGASDLNVGWSIELKAVLIGKLLGERMYCRDNENMNSGWGLRGYVRGQ